jgi:hypothetical protein
MEAPHFHLPRGKNYRCLQETSSGCFILSVQNQPSPSNVTPPANCTLASASNRTHLERVVSLNLSALWRLLLKGTAKFTNTVKEPKATDLRGSGRIR